MWCVQWSKRGVKCFNLWTRRHIKTERDSAVNLNYWDRTAHLRLKKKNMYVVLLLNLMRGSVTNNRFGTMPTFLLNILMNDKLVKFNLKYTIPTQMLASVVQLSDIIREKIAKPVYRSMPTGFKVWYDKVRYKL